MQVLGKLTLKLMSDLFFENGSHMPWSTLKDLHSIPSRQYFTWMQVLDAMPDDWKILLKGNGEYTIKLMTQIRQRLIIKYGSVID